MVEWSYQHLSNYIFELPFFTIIDFSLFVLKTKDFELLGFCVLCLCSDLIIHSTFRLVRFSFNMKRLNKQQVLFLMVQQFNSEFYLLLIQSSVHFCKVYNSN